MPGNSQRSVKTPVTVRLNGDLLEAVRQNAARENRTLTNFIETALIQRVSESHETKLHLTVTASKTKKRSSDE